MSIVPPEIKFILNAICDGEIIQKHSGRSGLVYVLKRSKHPNLICIKTIIDFEKIIESGFDIHTSKAEEKIVNYQREVFNWIKFSGNSCIITPFEVKVFHEIPFVIMPFCHGDLSDLFPKINDHIGRLLISVQIINCFIQAGKKSLLQHQDVKPENFLYRDLSKDFHDFPPLHLNSALSFQVKIADFGVANAYLNNYPGGTNIYRSPEQILNDEIDKEKFKPDIFSAGIILCELFQGFHPIYKKIGDKKSFRSSEYKKWALNGERNIDRKKFNEEKKIIDIVKSMLSPDPDSRPSFECIFKVLRDLLIEKSEKDWIQLDSILKVDADNEFIGDEAFNFAKIPTNFKHYDSHFIQFIDKIKNSIEIGGINNLIFCQEAINRCGQIILDKKIDIYKKCCVFLIEETIKINREITCEKILGTEVEGFSDIEFISDYIGANIRRLDRFEEFEAYLIDLKISISHSNDKRLYAALLYYNASRKYQARELDDAIVILGHVLELFPNDLNLINLKNRWESLKYLDFFNDSQ